MKRSIVGPAILVAVVVAGASLGMSCGGQGTQQTGSLIAVNNGNGEQGSTQLSTFMNAKCEATVSGLSGPLSTNRQGSSVALTRAENDHLIALVADHDRDRLVVVDMTDQKVLSSEPTFGSPEQVQILNDGRAVVSISSANHVEVFQLTNASKSDAKAERLCARPVAAGPFGLATTPDGSSVVVTSAWEPALTKLDTASFTPKVVSRLARAPRGVLVDDSNHAYVSHVVGANLSVVDLGIETADAKNIPLGVRAGSAQAQDADLNVVRLGSQAYSLTSVEITKPASSTTAPQTGNPTGPETPPNVTGTAPKPNPKPAVPSINPTTTIVPPQPQTPSVRIVVPMVSVDPGAPERPTRYYYGPPPVAGVPKQAPVAIVVDPKGQRTLTTRVVATTGNERSGECFVPRASASVGDRLFVTCLGLDEVLELDGRSADPMRTIRARYSVAKGPTGVAIATQENAAVVYSQFDEEIALVKLDGSPGVRVHLDGGISHLDDVAAAGRDIFYRSDDPRITAEGLACQSCHPDGTEDGITWSTPEGLRQTPMLAGRLHGSAPFGWSREQETLETYVTDTCNRLGGSGLPAGELSELATFIDQLPSPPVSQYSAKDAERGREVFIAQKCDECHVGATGTDHRSYTFSSNDSTRFDTPSLKNVGLTAPYFHDGRYTTMSDLLNDPANAMGHITQVPVEDRKALEAYLESL